MRHKPRWTVEQLPSTLKILPEDQREYALKVANALVCTGVKERHALMRGVRSAKRWALQDHKEQFNDLTPGPARHVRYSRGRWLVVSEYEEERERRFNNLQHAVASAHEMASADDGAVYVYTNAAIAQKHEPDISTCPSATRFHVAPYRDAWAVNRQAGHHSYFETFRTKRKALKHARDVARDNLALLVVHRSDGQVQRFYDYRAS